MMASPTRKKTRQRKQKPEASFENFALDPLGTQAQISKLSLALSRPLGLNLSVNKGCAIAGGATLVLLILCCGGGGFMIYQNLGPAILIAVQTDVDDFRKRHPEVAVEPTNEAWTKALTNPENGLENQQAWVQLAQAGQGELVDIPYLNPLRFVPQPDGSVLVVSNGKDGLPDTEDDESSVTARAKFQK